MQKLTTNCCFTESALVLVVSQNWQWMNIDAVLDQKHIRGKTNIVLITAIEHLSLDDPEGCEMISGKGDQSQD